MQSLEGKKVNTWGGREEGNLPPIAQIIYMLQENTRGREGVPAQAPASLGDETLIPGVEKVPECKNVQKCKKCKKEG